MKKVFVKEADFPKFSKGKDVKSYPNPFIKDVNGQSVEIIPADERIVVKKLTLEEKNWLCGVKTDKDVIEMSVTVGGWFPTELVCGTIPIHLGYGIIRSRYSMNTDLAQETGWLQKTEMSGSRTNIFLLSKKDVAIKKLQAAGFIVIDNTQKQ